jgi:hypothetical protein
MAERNGRTQDRRLAFRIGLNLGVIVQNGDLYGDGSTAARSSLGGAGPSLSAPARASANKIAAVRIRRSG